MSPLGLTPKELAARIGKSLTTITDWRRTKKGPPYVVAEGRIHYPPDQLAQWLAHHTHNAIE